MKKFLLILILLLAANATYALDCSKYETFDMERAMRGDAKYRDTYVECTLDNKISKLNSENNFEKQSIYWDNIGFLQEHCYDNSGDGNTKLTGKYKTVNALDKAMLIERTLYKIGTITNGYFTYVGPKYECSSKHAWNDYYDVVVKEYSRIRDLNNNEQKILSQKLQTQIAYFTKNGNFKNNYYFNTYIMNLIGIVENIKSSDERIKLKESIASLYTMKESDLEIFKIINVFCKTE